MKKIDVLISITLFTILILIVGCILYSFYDPYGQILLIPLGLLSIYYLVLFAFSKLVLTSSRTSFYIGIILLSVPIISLGMAYDRFVSFSIDLLQFIHTI